MLQQTLRTKVHLLQAPRMSMVTSYTRLFHSSQIHRSEICAFRSSIRLNTNKFTDVFPTKIDKLEADVNGLKGDVSVPKLDIKELGYSMKKQLDRHVLNMEKIFSQDALNREKLFSRFYFRSLFSVLGAAILLVGSSWILSMNGSERLDAEIKRRAIIKYVAERRRENNVGVRTAPA